MVAKQAKKAMQAMLTNGSRSLAALAVAAAAFGASPGTFPAAVAAGESERQSPRDRRPGDPAPETQREIELKQALKDNPRDTAGVVMLTKLQQARGAAAEARQTLHDALRVEKRVDQGVVLYHALGALLSREGDFAGAVDAYEQAALLDPNNPAAHHLVGTFFFEKSRDTSLIEADRRTLIERGLAAEERALQLRADYMEAMVYKNLLLRVQATLEADPARQKALIAAADALRTRALELMKSQPAQPQPVRPDGAAPPPPPPPPPPPARRGGGLS